MAKLYPPQIEGTIPACYLENGTIYLTVPFAMSKVVSRSEISQCIVKIKSILNGEVLTSQYSSAIDYDNNNVKFSFTSDKLEVGQFYKVQLAYVDKDKTVGYYSTVGITKLTCHPSLEIVDLVPGRLYNVKSTYVGKYKQGYEDEINEFKYKWAIKIKEIALLKISGIITEEECQEQLAAINDLYSNQIKVLSTAGDITEKLYSYRFDIYNSNNELFYTTGDILHNHETDSEAYESIDTFNLTKSLPDDEIFTLYYRGTTSNGLEVSSRGYRIYTGETVDPTIDLKVNAEMDNDNGVCRVSLSAASRLLNGHFILSRSFSGDNFSSWQQIKNYSYNGKVIEDFEFVDYTIEHGYSYQYAIQQTNANNGLISNRIKSNIITAEFDDMFLFDGERQLKVAFNPQVSSFKTMLQESKQQTIGGKYPYFFRNGYTAYKEFPISGLISYHTDGNQMFLKDKDMQLDDYSSFQRQSTLQHNISSEDMEYFMNLGDLGLGYQLLEQYRERDKENSEYQLIKNQHGRSTSLEHYNFLAERIFKMTVLDFLNNGKPKLFRSPAEGNYIVQLMNTSLSPNTQVGRMLHTFSTTADEVADFSWENLQKYNFVNTEEEKYTMNNIKFEVVSMPTVEEQLELGNRWSDNLITHSIVQIHCQDMFLGDKILINDETEIQIGTTGEYEMTFDEPITSLKVLYPLSPDAKINCLYYTEPEDSFSIYGSITIEEEVCRQIVGNGKEIELISYSEDKTSYEELLRYHSVLFQRKDSFYNLDNKKNEEKTNELYNNTYVIINGQKINLGYKDELFIKDASFIKTIILGSNVVANLTYLKKVVTAAQGEVFADEQLPT